MSRLFIFFFLGVLVGALCVIRFSHQLPSTNENTRQLRKKLKPTLPVLIVDAAINTTHKIPIKKTITKISTTKIPTTKTPSTKNPSTKNPSTKKTTLKKIILRKVIKKVHNNIKHVTTTTKKAPIVYNGKLFLCGYSYSWLSFVYPTKKVERYDKNKVSQKTDVMLNGLYGPQCGIDTFKGNIIHINAEVGKHKHSTVPPNTLGPGGIRAYYVQLVSHKIPNIEKLLFKKRENTGEHFMSYTHKNCVPFREEAFTALSKISKVDALGKCKHNVDAKYQATFGDDWVNNWKYPFSRYRFTLCMENKKERGYITEKILNAFISGTIPVYYGTDEIFNLFNKKAFIFYDINNPELAIAKIKWLEANPEAYKQMLNEPILAADAYQNYFSREAIKRLFSHATMNIPVKTLEAANKEEVGYVNFRQKMDGMTYTSISFTNNFYYVLQKQCYNYVKCKGECLNCSLVLMRSTSLNNFEVVKRFDKDKLWTGCLLGNSILSVDDSNKMWLIGGSGLRGNAGILGYCDGIYKSEFNYDTLSVSSTPKLMYKSVGGGLQSYLDGLPNLIKHNGYNYLYVRYNPAKGKRLVRVLKSKSFTFVESSVIDIGYYTYYANIVSYGGKIHGFFHSFPESKLSDWSGHPKNSAYDALFVVYATSTDGLNFKVINKNLFPNLVISPVNGIINSNVFFLEHHLGKLHKYSLEPLQSIKRPILTIIILSARENKEHRDIIRKTWKSGHTNVYFIVGKNFCQYPPDSRHSYTCNFNGKAVSKESSASYYRKQNELTKQLQLEKDVVLVDMVDVYRNLAKKLKLAYKWIYNNINPLPLYILKVDEDTFVRVASLERWLSKRDPKVSNSYNIVAADFVTGGVVSRTGKWSETNYKKSRYPPFPSGAGHIINAKLLKLIMNNIDDFVTYQGEDTSLGIFFDLMKASNKIKVQLEKSQHFTSHNGECMDKTKFVIGHNIKPSKMRDCYNHMDEIPEKHEIYNKPNRKYLLFTSAGDKNNVKQWIGSDRNYDIAVVYYGKTSFNLGVDMLYSNYDTKFPNLRKFYSNLNLDQYNLVAVWDDDIVADVNKINNIFLEMDATTEATIGSPCHTRGRWLTLHKNGKSGLRLVNFVEMNAPIFRPRFLKLFLENFDVTLKGYGTDIWYSHVCSKQPSCKIVVSDTYCVTNPKSRSDGTREIEKFQSESVRANMWFNLAKKLKISFEGMLSEAHSKPKTKIYLTQVNNSLKRSKVKSLSLKTPVTTTTTTTNASLKKVLSLKTTTRPLVLQKTKKSFINPFKGGGMSKKEVAFLTRVYQYSTSIFEWGMGSSSALANFLGVKVLVSVDSYKKWVEQTKSVVNNGRYKFLYVNIGRVREWGFPVEPQNKRWLDYSKKINDERNSFDVYLVDGRFRVACACMALLHGRNDSSIMFHDFNREYYQEILQAADKIKQVESLAQLRKKSGADNILHAMWKKYKYDSR